MYLTTTITTNFLLLHIQTLNKTALEQVADSKYLSVTIQQDLKFNKHIEAKITTAKRQLGMIKRALYWAPQRAKLLAYKSLCMPQLEYATAAWDTSNKGEVVSLEQVQNQAVRSIAGIKGTRGVNEATERLGPLPLQQRKRQQRFSLLMRILDREDTYPALVELYGKLINRSNNFIQTRAQHQGHPTFM